MRKKEMDTRYNMFVKEYIIKAIMSLVLSIVGLFSSIMAISPILLEKLPVFLGACSIVGISIVSTKLVGEINESILNKVVANFISSSKVFGGIKVDYYTVREEYGKTFLYISLIPFRNSHLKAFALTDEQANNIPLDEDYINEEFLLGTVRTVNRLEFYSNL